MRNIFEKIQKNSNDDSDYEDIDSEDETTKEEEVIEIDKYTEKKEETKIYNFFEMIKKRITNNNNDSDIQPPLSDSENEGDYSFIIKDLKSNKNQSINHIQQKQKKQYDSDTDEICDTLSEEETNNRYIENINKLKKNSKQISFFPSSKNSIQTTI